MAGSLSQLSQVKPGGHELRREVVVHHQRERILAAVVELVAESGYRDVSVATIVKRARTGRLKFYELFDSKEDCFLAAYDAGFEEAAGGSERRSRPATARSPIGSTPASAPCSTSSTRAPTWRGRWSWRRRCWERRWAIAARPRSPPSGRSSPGPGGREEAKLPDEVEESVLDGLYWLLYDAILAGKPKRLAKLRPALVEFALMPFVEAVRG